MEVTKTTHLGKALTTLDLEDKFLSNGELAHFPLIERGRIANDVIAEKLNRGKWESVVKMIYGGFGKADALFEGDYQDLKDKIVASALTSNTDHINEELLNILQHRRENDLLFQLATKLPLKYADFEAIASRIHRSYFEDPTEGLKKLQVLYQIGGKKALEHQEFSSAFRYLKEIEDAKGLENLFDIIFSKRRSYEKRELLEKIALGDEEKKNDRLKKMILSCLEEKLNALESLDIWRKNPNIKITEKEREALYHQVAQEVSIYDIKEKLKNEDPELLLLWAKKHAKSDPKSAYRLFSKFNYNGTPLILAVLSGLGEKQKINHSEQLTTDEIQETHLRRGYPMAPFSIKTQIARHLKDHEELKKLSKIANQNGNSREAYDLWTDAQGDLTNPYITKIREKLIKKELQGEWVYLRFLSPLDAVGKIQAYEALVKDAQNQKDKKAAYRRFEIAYNLARNLGDEEKTQIAREQMVAISPTRALGDFRHKDETTKCIDEKGVDYVLGFVSNQYNTDKETLKSFLAKYNAD